VALFDNPKIPSHIELQIYPYRQYSGLTNMSLDHYFASNYDKYDIPIFRFYGWNPFCLSMGYHQSANTIDKVSLKNDGYDLIRRPTGGRAILHSEELTYSIIFPKNIFSQQDLYNYIHQIFTKALNSLTYAVKLATNKQKLPVLKDSATDYPCFTKSAETEVEYDGKKLIGSAQKIYPHSILQHGSILIGKYHENLSKYLISSDNERKLIKKEIKSKTICLNSINGRNITAQDIENETLKQLESNDNISLIFRQFDEKFFDEAVKFYKKEIKNK